MGNMLGNGLGNLHVITNMHVNMVGKMVNNVHSNTLGHKLLIG